MRTSPMRFNLLSTLAAFLLAATPAAAQPEAPDTTRGRVYTLVGGAIGDGAFITTGAGARLKLAPQLGLELELVHLSGIDDRDRAHMVLSDPPDPGGVLESDIPFYGWTPFDRPRRDATTLQTKIVVEFPLAAGRLFPYLAAGGGIGRVTESFGAGNGFVSWVPAESIANEPQSMQTSGSDPGSDTVHFFDNFSFTFPRFGEYSELGLALSLGGGVDVRVWRGLGLGVDIRWLRILRNYDHVDTAQVASSVSYRF